eukprot:CAMPEP_0115156384 /NCGR_PEP_ID=MMETSP0227-20121206/68407_1 /TAXON_ID=89957 /ORGANISM="Polarella glacialis, Strain CCMP 1383" /LENGTH=31 /DNA_ID= /DNA_START= /DNA_END= /DNA_ORIENTATION=
MIIISSLQFDGDLQREGRNLLDEARLRLRVA